MLTFIRKIDILQDMANVTFSQADLLYLMKNIDIMVGKFLVLAKDYPQIKSLVIKLTTKQPQSQT